MLELEFMQRALIACTVIAATAPLVGSFIVQRGHSLIGDGMGHMAFAGVGLALLTGMHPLIGALGLTVIAAVTLVPMSKRSGGGDLSLALLFYGGISAGYLFVSRSGGGQTAVVGLLFGSPLNLQWWEVATITALAGIVLLITAVVYRQLLAMAFDEPSARVAGIPTQALTLLLTLMVALIVVAGMTTIGLLLISAMMVVPVAAATQIAGSYRATLAIASGIGALSAVLGLTTSYYGDFAPGAAIVVIAILCYLVTAVSALLKTRYHRSHA
ncbi:ABC transporter [Nesterenkonia sp. AN1]|uniref:metal ABC transporter permease n=1 Tax=Nesterenkonia sp. AN1 TaxID=652017 RepID=UPI0004490413|nr:metal ABC transporter permease [Nesterenkonia sp. AN1]EXF23917.1 ABC transporter [Nesterenkonia sp. AN1]